MRFAPLAFALALAACGAPRVAGDAGPRSRPGATVLTRADLGASGDLLTALTGRVPSMRVTRRAGSRCPVLVLRGERSLAVPAQPSVYVDGTPMTDTCILAQLRAGDVERVEVYPGGLAPQPSIAPNPAGLILVVTAGPDSVG